MAGEPRLESFFANMEDESFSTQKLNENREYLEEILWYLDSLRADEVVKALRKNQELEKDGQKTRRIIKNIVRLYPLSQALVIKILNEISQSDYAFMQGLDVSQSVQRAIKQLISEAENQSGKTTREFQDYKQKVDQLEEEREKLEEQASNFHDLIERKRELKEAIEKLKNETNEENILADIGALEDEKNELMRKREMQKARKEKLHIAIQEIKKELSLSEEKFENPEEINLLRELLGKFPPDAEDGR